MPAGQDKNNSATECRRWDGFQSLADSDRVAQMRSGPDKEILAYAPAERRGRLCQHFPAPQPMASAAESECNFPDDLPDAPAESSRHKLMPHDSWQLRPLWDPPPA